MNLFLGSCPVVRDEGIYLDGQRVIRFGLAGVGLDGDVGNLLAYRAEWEPFIAAHLQLWRDLNSWFESSSEAKKCPPGIFTAEQNNDPNPTTQSFCAALSLTRRAISDTALSGIPTMWNAWKNKSNAEILAGARKMLEWHQSVVMQVGGDYQRTMLTIMDNWHLPHPQLPSVPDFTAQQNLIAQLEGEFIEIGGLLQIIGYGIGGTLVTAGNLTAAVAEGITEAAKKIPDVVSSKWLWFGTTAVLAVVGGALVIYYIPRKKAA